MKYVTAVPKGNTQSIIIGMAGIGLIFDGWFIEGITADGTGVGADIPGPHGDFFLDQRDHCSILCQVRLMIKQTINISIFLQQMTTPTHQHSIS